LYTVAHCSAAVVSYKMYYYYCLHIAVVAVDTCSFAVAAVRTAAQDCCTLGYYYSAAAEQALALIFYPNCYYCHYCYRYFVPAAVVAAFGRELDHYCCFFRLMSLALVEKKIVMALQYCS